MTKNCRSSVPRAASRLSALVAVCLVVSGCASLLRSPVSGAQSGRAGQHVSVTSEPPGATIVLRGQRLGVTPTIIVLNRKDSSQILRLEKDGFQPVDVPVKRRVSALIAGNAPLALIAMMGAAWDSRPGAEARATRNALILPALGVGVDLLTGAGFKLPSRLHVTLERNDE